MTNRPDDLAVVDAAVRLAAPRKAPVLLAAVLPAPSQIPDRARVDAQAARVFLARVLPRLRAAAVGYIPVAASCCGRCATPATPSRGEISGGVPQTSGFSGFPSATRATFRRGGGVTAVIPGRPVRPC
ncbi:hypothetical protein [Streptomyces sp. NPDC050121]|uniref:hypothetical protein n=1 Tax=Streptomyces sp. NPDC050121 TaxID=3365601 RepID=UPI0037AC7595